MPRSGSRPFLCALALLFPFILPSVASARSVAPSSGYSTSITSHGLKVTLTLSKRTFANRELSQALIVVQNVSKSSMLPAKACLQENPHIEVMRGSKVVFPPVVPKLAKAPCLNETPIQLSPTTRAISEARFIARAHGIRAVVSYARLTGKKGKHGPYFTVRTPILHIGIGAAQGAPKVKLCTKQPLCARVQQPAAGGTVLGPMYYAASVSCTDKKSQPRAQRPELSVEIPSVKRTTTPDTLYAGCQHVVHWNFAVGWLNHSVTFVSH